MRNVCCHLDCHSPASHAIHPNGGHEETFSCKRHLPLLAGKSDSVWRLSETGEPVHQVPIDAVWHGPHAELWGRLCPDCGPEDREEIAEAALKRIEDLEVLQVV